MWSKVRGNGCTQTSVGDVDCHSFSGRNIKQGWERKNDSQVRNLKHELQREPLLQPDNATGAVMWESRGPRGAAPRRITGTKGRWKRGLQELCTPKTAQLPVHLKLLWKKQHSINFFKVPFLVTVIYLDRSLKNNSLVASCRFTGKSALSLIACPYFFPITEWVFCLTCILKYQTTH